MLYAVGITSHRFTQNGRIKMNSIAITEHIGNIKNRISNPFAKAWDKFVARIADSIAAHIANNPALAQTISERIVSAIDTDSIGERIIDDIMTSDIADEISDSIDVRVDGRDIAEEIGQYFDSSQIAEEIAEDVQERIRDVFKSLAGMNE